MLGKETFNPNRLDLAVVAGLALATVAVYGQVAGFGFLTWDDAVYVTDNPLVRDGLSRETLLRAFGTLVGANWHPLTVLSHALDVQLFGLHAGAHHLVNVLLHLVNSVLLYGFFRVSTGDAGRSALVAAAFAVHPLHVESVAWIAERKDVLSTFFWLLLLLSYLRWAQRRSVGSYAGVMLFLVLGLLTKPMLVTVPLVLLLLDFWPLRRLRDGGSEEPRRLVLEKLPFALVAAVFALVALWSQRVGGGQTDVVDAPLALRLANAVVSCVVYLVKTIVPRDLAFLYPYPESIPVWRAVLALALIAAVTGLVARGAGRRPALLVGWLWYLVTLVPVIGIVQIGLQSHADRYTYVPLVGIFVMIAWGVPWGVRVGRLRPLPIAAVVALAALTVAAHVQAAYWRDDSSLYRRAISVTRGNFVAHGNLAWILERQGRLDEAEAEARAALAARPEDARALVTLGTVEYRRGRKAEAAAAYRRATESDPWSAKAWYNLGVVLRDTNELRESEACFRQAVALAPNMPQARRNLAAVLERSGRIEEALAQYHQAARLEPGHAGTRVWIERLERRLRARRDAVPGSAEPD